MGHIDLVVYSLYFVEVSPYGQLSTIISNKVPSSNPTLLSYGNCSVLSIAGNILLISCPKSLFHK